MSRYIIGIDLGTTNIAVAYLDTTADSVVPLVFPITQVTDDGESAASALLPSFLYLPGAGDTAAGRLALPWADAHDFSVGALARKKAATVPNRVISSAKSWLCANNIDRLASVLPWGLEEATRKLSPVEVSRRYLEHVRDAWNHEMAADDKKARFEKQTIVLTVPASFDAVARELTVRAAESAGLTVTLLEEPQAACYAWLQEYPDSWRKQMKPGERILVCDIGGGTTDFSLIEVADEKGDLALQRIAVGRHILLGGDNLDLALAHIVAAKLQKEKNIKVDHYQLVSLTHACRDAKEPLLATPDVAPQKITILGRGSSVVGRSVSVTLSFDEIAGTVLDGFFPRCGFADRPVSQPRAGLRSFGLNYEADPAVTRHLAAFLSAHGESAQDRTLTLPGLVLFNGGVTKSAILRDRIIEVLNHWRADQDRPVVAISESHPELAVAIGACWYGYVAQGHGIRIKAGSAHTFYIGVESSLPAVPGFAKPLETLCVLPFGTEEGTELDVPHSELGLIVGETTEFRFFSSNVRKADRAGDCPTNLAGHEDVIELPPLAANLPVEDTTTPPGTLIPIRLRAVLTEIGTLQIWCLEQDGERRWKLEYELRAPAQPE